MSRYEWVPWNFLTTSSVLSIAPGFAVQLPLLNPNAFAVAEVSGIIENNERYFVHRIVGQLQWSANEGMNVTGIIVPGLLEVSGADAITTVFGTSGVGATVAANVWTAELANAEFWWFRHWHEVGTVGQDPLEHPWWSTVDIKPKRVMGKQETPVLVVSNEGGGEAVLQMFFQLRALVSRL